MSQILNKRRSLLWYELELGVDVTIDCFEMHFSKKDKKSKKYKKIKKYEESEVNPITKFSFQSFVSALLI